MIFFRIRSRKFRRRVILPLFIILGVSAAIGASFGLFFSEIGSPPSKRIPLAPFNPNSATAPPINSLGAHELETRIRVNPCIDLHSYVCALARTEDPTGDVRRDSEGEVAALRIFEDIVNEIKKQKAVKKKSIRSIDDELVKRIYTPGRTKRVRDLFDKAKENLLEFIDSQPFSALTEMDKDILRKRIERVVLELPPPASVYADEPDLFTRNDVYYERTANGVMRIRIGGALLFTVKSKFNLAFTLAHELAHAIDPCELLANKIDISSYRGLSECFGSPSETLPRECSSKGKLSEIFADWVATHVVVKILDDSMHQYSRSQVRSAVFNAVRDLCREDVNDTDDDDDSALDASHPSESFRVNRIFAQHPQVRKYLGCKDTFGPTLPGVPSYCFWSTVNKPNAAH